MVIQPTRYSCFAACLSFLCDVPIAEIFEEVGHNGHDYPFTDDELQYWCLKHGYILTRFDHASDVDAFDYAMNCHDHPGILRINKGGENDHALVIIGNLLMDPADGTSLFLKNLRNPVAAYYMLTDL